MENYYKLWSDCEQCLSWKIGNCEFSLNSFRYGVRKYDAYEYGRLENLQANLIYLRSICQKRLDYLLWT